MWNLLLAAVAATAVVLRLDRSRREARLRQEREAVLEAIRRLEPMGTGYTIGVEVEKILGRGMSLGGVFYHLMPLERDRVIASRWGEPKPNYGNRRPRHYWIAVERHQP